MDRVWLRLFVFNVDRIFRLVPRLGARRGGTCEPGATLAAIFGVAVGGSYFGRTPRSPYARILTGDSGRCRSRSMAALKQNLRPF